MDALQLLTWSRGTGLSLALALFLFGTALRLLEIYGLGRKPDLSAARHAAGASGWHTVFRRSLPPEGFGMLKKSPATYIGGYAFHLGLAVSTLLFAPHITLFRELAGLSWPALPSQVVDLAAVLTLAAMVVLLADRINKPAKRYLSGAGDWLAWLLTFLPVATGWLAVHHLMLPYTFMLAAHILCAEILLAALPFTKLFHAFTLFGSRWFNGAANGHKGIPV